MFKKAKSALASLFGELADIQKDIDDSARRIVEGVVRMIDLVDDEARSSRDALPGRDFSWYEDVARTLASNGFSSPEAFEPRSWMSRPVESRTIAEYALGDGGVIVATWFAIAGTETRPTRTSVDLLTLFEDGTKFETVAGSSPSPLPLLDTEHDEWLPEGTPVHELLARHRATVAAHGSAPKPFASVEAFLASRVERRERRAAFRRGLGLSLVERYIERSFPGERAEMGAAYLDAIRKHPEWYKYAGGNSGDDARSPETAAGETSSRAAAPDEHDSVPAMPLNFLMSPTDDGRRTLTTFGLLFSGLPELLMTDVAANHCRAARVLAGTVATGIARLRAASANDAELDAQLVSESGVTITLTLADALAAHVTQMGGTPGSEPVDVHVALRGFTPDDEPSMLHLNPLPRDPRSFDDRLREACARLGVDVPEARDEDSADAAMQEAHERAVARLADVRARWRARTGAEEQVLVKIRATKGEHGEYVWLEVRDWRDGALDGAVVTPAPRVGLALGQQITIEEGRVYDELVMGASGAPVPALTDVVATDYGMDI